MIVAHHRLNVLWSCVTHWNYHLSIISIQKGGYLRCTFIHFFSAFNPVPRQQIAGSLSSCVSPCYLVDLVSNYFSDRTQYVQHGKRISDLLPNDCGVPQGMFLRLPFIPTTPTASVAQMTAVF